MNLTDKCKSDFEKWFRLNSDELYYRDVFDELPFNMQYGVLVDWFDSVVIFITDGRHRVSIYDHITNESFIISGIRKRQEAINKANEILNDRLQKKKKDHG